MDKEYWKYQKLAWSTACREFLHHFEGWKKVTEPFAVAFLTLICSIVVLRIFRKGVDVSDWWIVAVSTVGGPFLYVVFIFASKRVFAPFKLYQDKKSEADLHTWKDIEVKVFSFPKYSNYGIGLEIISHKPLFVIENNNIREYLIETYPEIEYIKLEGRITASRIKLPMLTMGTKSVFRISHEILNQRQFNKLISTVAIPIASHDESKAWITDYDEKQECSIEADKTYTLQIEMRGSSLEGRPMDGCTIYCDLFYGKNKEGQMEVSLDITGREPAYEN